MKIVAHLLGGGVGPEGESDRSRVRPSRLQSRNSSSPAARRRPGLALEYAPSFQMRSGPRDCTASVGTGRLAGLRGLGPGFEGQGDGVGQGHGLAAARGRSMLARAELLLERGRERAVHLLFGR
jgi:hypothetical protein